MRRHITADDVLASMRMARHTFSGTWLLCEGETDRAVLDRFVDGERCRVQPCQGKRGVLEVMSKRARARLSGAVAVVDSDFWWLDGRQPPRDVIATDCHDLEAMLIASPALEAVLAEHTDTLRLAAYLERVALPSVRELLYDRVRTSSHLRLVNSREDLGLRFARVDVTDHLEPAELRFDAMGYLRAVHAQSSTHASLDQVGRMLVGSLRQEHDPRLLCHGHDLVRVLTYLLREGGFSIRPRSAYRADLVEKDLRLAYDSRYFRRSGLYATLAAWDSGRGAELLDV